MADHTPPEKAPRKRRIRRRYIVLASILLLLGVSWKAAESYIDIEHYRPLIDKELELLIELPLAFGAMDLQLFPTPRLVVENVALGEDDFMAFSPKVVVTANLTKLLHKQLELKVVAIQDLRVQLPEENPVLRQRWSDYMLALDTPDLPTGKPMLKVTLDRIVAEEAEVFRGPLQYATGDLEVTGVTGGAPVFTFAADGAGVAGHPKATGAFTLTVKNDPLLQGAAKVTNLPLANLTGDDTLPQFILNGDLEYAQAQDDAWRFGSEGEVRLREEQEPLGSFTLAARYAAGDLVFEQIQVDSTPLTFQGNLALLDSGAWELGLASAVLKDRGITWLVERLPEIPFMDNPEISSEAALNNVRLGNAAGNAFSIAEGAIAVHGVDLRLDGAYALPDVQGLATVSGNTFEIAALVSRHLDVVGTVRTEFEAGSVTLDLGGLLQLQPDFPLPPGLAADFRAENGAIDLRELHAELPGGALDIPALRLDAAMQDAAISAWDDATSTFVPVPHVSGSVTVAAGVVQVANLTSAFSELNATLTPDATLERWAFEGTLTSDLASPIWKPLFHETGVTVTAGALECTRLAGTLVAGSYTPEALEVAASIREFKAAVDTGGYRDQLRFNTIALAATNTECTAKLSGGTDTLGPLDANVAWTFSAGDVKGSLTLHPGEAKNLPAAYREGTAGKLLTRLTPLPLAIEYSGASGLLNFSADAPLPLSGHIALPRLEETQAPFGLALSASMPAEWLAPLAPDATLAGAVTLQAELNAQDGKIEARADATNAEFAWSLIKKSSGLPAEASLRGQWENDGPAFSAGLVQLAGQQAPLTNGPEGLACKAFTLDLAALAPLLPEGASLGGTASGSVGGGLSTVDITLDGATFKANTDAPAFTASGQLLRGATGWTLDTLACSVGASAGTADIRQAADGWRGDIEATHISIDDLAKTYNAITALPGSRPADAPPEATDAPFQAQIQITAKTLQWADATVERVRGSLESGGAGLALHRVSFVHGSGAGAGDLVYLARSADKPGEVKVELQLNEMNADLIEGLFMSEAREMEGLFSGSATLAFPPPSNGASILNGMNGHIRFEAVNGTLGKAGLASKFLTALRTTDLLRLRIPQLRDRGLTFKTLSGDIAIESGVFHLAPYAMADSTYVLEAEARFDFPKDTADGNAEIQVLEGVTGVARKIPILGDAAGLVSKMLGVPIKITGTATDPTFRVGMPGQ